MKLFQQRGAFVFPDERLFCFRIRKPPIWRLFFTSDSGSYIVHYPPVVVLKLYSFVLPYRFVVHKITLKTPPTNESAPAVPYAYRDKTLR